MVSNETRKCVFCGATPVSREHIWPQWATTLLKNSPRGFPSGARDTIRDRGGREYRWTTRKVFDDVAKTVCRKCNSGWMNDIESVARPHLRPLIEGDISEGPISLGQQAREAIATWIALRAIIIRSTHTPPTPPLLGQWFDWLYTQHTCPQNWWVWIATYVGDLIAHWETHTFHPYKTQEPLAIGQIRVLDTTAFNGLIMTGFIGHFAFKVVGLGSGQPLNIGGNALAQIAPFQGQPVDWPPRNVITNDTIIQFFKAGTTSESLLEKYWDEIKNS